MNTLRGWWKGEDNLIDSVNGNTGVIWHGGATDNHTTYIDGVVNRAIFADFTDHPAGQAFYFPASVLYDVGPTGALILEFYIKLVSDISKQKVFYLLLKAGDYDIGLNFVNVDWGLKIENGNLKIVTPTGFRTVEEFSSGGTLPYDDTWHKVKVNYYNGYWETFINDIDVTINPDNQHFITNNHYPVDFAVSFAGAVDVACGFDEIKIYTDSVVSGDSILDLDACGTTTLFRILPEWSREPSMETQFGRDIIQYDEAMTQFRFLTSELGWKVTAEFFNIDKSVEFSILDFFHQRKGKLNRFWLPAWAKYFVLDKNIAPLATTFFLAENNTFQYVYRGYERFFMLLKNGDMLTRKITASLGNGEYSVASAFDRAISPEDISLFGKLILVRFDQDEISMQHDTTDLSNCTLTFQELGKEYL